MILLKTQNISKYFGALLAVNNVSLQVKSGNIHSIIGPNGAGKTTLFNILSGHLSPSSGEVFFQNRNITHYRPHQISKINIGRSFQITNIFYELSVFENVRIAAQSRTKCNFSFYMHVKNLRSPQEKAKQILIDLGLWENRDQKASELSHGYQRSLELGIALATEPILLLLDEPTSGLSPEETLDMIQLIQDIGKKITILIVEHNMNLVMSISDKITVLSQGKLIAEGSAETIQRDPDVQRVYLGGEC